MLTPDDMKACGELQDFSRVRIPAIVEAVAEASGVTVAQIMGKYRGKATWAKARDLVAYIARREGFTFEAIGKVLGRDHSSVMSAVNREATRRGE